MSQTTNKLRSTNVYGSFGNYDTSTGSILASGTFQRNLFVGGDLVLGTETIDASGNAIDSNSNIKFTLNKVPYTIPLRILSYIQNVSSDIQAQINNISASSGNISSVGYLTQTLPDTSSTQFGNQAYNTTATGFNNTAIGSSNLFKNTTGNYNTSVGFISMSDNTTGGGNTSIGYSALGKNTSGSSNTSVGLGALSNNTTGNDNCAIGQYSGLSMIATTASTCIGTNSNCPYSYSTALGFNSTCTNNHQIMLGTVQETVVVPNDLTFGGSINEVPRSKLSYIKNVSSDVQNQLNNISNSINNIGNNALVLYSTLNVSGLATLTQVQNNTSLAVLQNISFQGSLNGITTSVFSYLSGLTGNIQNQINAISNTTPVGSVISFAGSASSLPGYLKCDGNLYSISSYPNLYNAIGTMYGGDSNQGWFNVPNYQGIFLRGAGNQTLDLQIPSNPKNYSSPPLGIFVTDKSVQPSDYVNGITQTVRSFITSANAFGPPNYNFNYSNAVASLQYSTGSNNVTENFPVHTSIQYFIKY